MKFESPTDFLAMVGFGFEFEFGCSVGPHALSINLKNKEKNGALSR